MSIEFDTTTVEPAMVEKTTKNKTLTLLEGDEFAYREKGITKKYTLVAGETVTINIRLIKQ